MITPAPAPTDPPPRPGRPYRRTPTPPTPKPSGDNTPAAEGVWVSTLTCSATSKAWKSSGERPPTRAPPPAAHHAAARPRSPTPRSRRQGMTLRPHLPGRQLQAGIEWSNSWSRCAGDRHPLGDTGGARGVDDVGDVSAPGAGNAVPGRGSMRRSLISTTSRSHPSSRSASPAVVIAAIGAASSVMNSIRAAGSAGSIGR